MSQAAAAAVSLIFVIGLTLVASAAPRLRRPRLSARLDPYLRGLEPRRTSLLHEEQPPLTPFPTLERLLRPVFEEGARIAERWLGGSAGVARRLRQAGLQENLPRFRAEQVLGASEGSRWPRRRRSSCRSSWAGDRPPSRCSAVLRSGCSAGPSPATGGSPSRSSAARRACSASSPTLADLICLAVTAGEAPRAAAERAVARSRGELSRELEVVLADLRAGVPFTTAMERLATRVPAHQVVRFVDGVVVAVERGTPLADVLRTQAADIREQRKRELIEAGGRREVLMLVPVVFLIMPVIILFALYPGIFALSQIAR